MARARHFHTGGGESVVARRGALGSPSLSVRGMHGAAASASETGKPRAKARAIGRERREGDGETGKKLLSLERETWAEPRSGGSELLLPDIGFDCPVTEN